MGEQQLNPHWRQVALGGNTGAAERHARSRQARLRIMVSAAGLFGEHGYRVVSFGMIAERAGVPKGSLTSYFPTKLLLARAITDEMRLRWEEMCSRADDRRIDPLSTLLAEVDEV
ncbi:MAG: TetR/AcrR family transcriptional regulator, partial [Microlunatus sp.]|nr:TetR/AcrR family transcriptional regulator [Microlunatus sp.]